MQRVRGYRLIPVNYRPRFQGGGPVGSPDEEHVGDPGIPLGPQPGSHVGRLLQIQPLNPDNPTEFHAPPMPGVMRGAPEAAPLPTRPAQDNEPLAALDARTPWSEAQPIVDANVARGLQRPVDKAANDLRLHLQRLDKADETGADYPGAVQNKRTVIPAPEGSNLPDFVAGKITHQDWIDRQEKLMTPDEIQSASQWYKTLRGHFLQQTGGNEAQADRYMRAWLVAQQNIGVAPAMGNVLLQAEQIARGVPPGEMRAAGMPNPTEAARAVLRGQPVEAGVGQKISDFVDSAEGKSVRSYMGNHPDGGAPFVVDVHTARDTGRVDDTLKNLLIAKGYDKKAVSKLKVDLSGGGIKGTDYENAALWGRGLTDHLNDISWQGREDWTPAEVQAVGWMGMTRLLHERAEDVTTAIGRNIRNISMELSPGEGSPWAQKYGTAFAALSPADQAAITHQITTAAIGHAAQITGIDPGTIVAGTGAWQKYQNPSTVAQTFASKDGADLTANILGHLLHQTEVWSNNVKPVTSSPKGFAVDFVASGNHTLNSNEGLRDFWGKVMEADPLKASKNPLFQGYQPIRAADGSPGIRVLVDRGGQGTQKAIDTALAPGGSIHGMLSGLPGDQAITVQRHEAEITKHRNDWTKNPNGEDYRQRLVKVLGGNSAAALGDAGRQLEDQLQAAIAAAQGQGQQRQIGGRVRLKSVDYAPRFADGGAAKVSKATAHYRWGTRARRCGQCTMFRQPSSCITVSGAISPMGDCKFFERKS